MQRIQSPAISSALRQALALDGAGSFGMEMEQRVVPVAVVANVTQQADEGTLVTVAGYNEVAAVAAQASRVALTWAQSIPDQNVRAIYVDKLTIVATTAMTVRIGINPPSAIVTNSIVALPQRKLSSAASESVSGQMWGDTAVGLISQAQAFMNVRLEANVSFVVKFDDPIVLDRGLNDQLVVAGLSANVDLRVSAEWRELRRA